MTLDFLDIFEQFGRHRHCYANRGDTRVRKDGSLEESWVQAASGATSPGGRSTRTGETPWIADRPEEE